MPGAVLVSAIPPLMLRTEANPNGQPAEAFDPIREASLADRSQLSGPFFGANRPGSEVSEGMKDVFWRTCMQSGHKNAYECIRVWSETDFTEDLQRFDVPTLIIHGEDDQVVPIGASAYESSKLVRGATLKVYPSAPHGLPDTHKEALNADLLAFLQTEARPVRAAHREERPEAMA